MVRPTVYNNLVTVPVMIEAELRNQAKAMGINISDVTRQALESMVGDPKSKDLFFKFNKIPKHQLDKVRRFVKEDNSRAEFWAGWLNKNYGSDLTAKDIMEYIDR